jgi:hypothetical protein
LPLFRVEGKVKMRERIMEDLELIIMHSHDLSHDPKGHDLTRHEVSKGFLSMSEETWPN